MVVGSAAYPVVSAGEVRSIIELSLKRDAGSLNRRFLFGKSLKSLLLQILDLGQARRRQRLPELFMAVRP
jgi:hypothetical protein